MQQCNCFVGDFFFVVGEVEFFGGGCFYVDVVYMVVEIFSDKDVYLWNMWQYFWCLGNNCDVDVVECIVSGLNVVLCFVQQFVVIGVFKCWIGIGEQFVDIVQCCGVKQCVGQCMQCDVVVGVGQQFFFIRNVYFVNDDWVFIVKSVYVKIMFNLY